MAIRRSAQKELHSPTPLVLLCHRDKTANSFYTTLCSSILTAKLSGKLLMQQKYMVSQLNQETTDPPAFYMREMELNNEILSKPTVHEQLEFYQSWKDRATLSNGITVLHYIAKIVQKHRKEREVLQREREKSMNGQKSAYVEILDFISDNIFACKSQGLANVMWALGRIKERDHCLVKVCEAELLQRDLSVFHPAEICQVLVGCTELELKNSPVLQRVEEAVLNWSIRKLSRCETRQVAGILTAFIKMDRGSIALFKTLEADILERNFRYFHNGQLTQFLRSFAIKDIFSDRLFDNAEDEILRRTPFKLLRTELVSILRAFATVGKGSEELFAAFDDEIVTRRVEDYYSAPLCWIIWAFATRGMTRSKVFRAVAQEIYQRDLQNLENGELSLCLYSYVLSEIPCRAFLRELEAEVMSRDLKRFHSEQLCQIVWSSTNAGLLSAELLQDIEGEIMQKNSSQNEGRMIVERFLNAEMGSEEQFSYLQKMCSLSL